MKLSPLAKIETLEQVFEYVLEVIIWLILSSQKTILPSFWHVEDLPERQPEQKGWEQKIADIWACKNELSAQFPDEIFYGKQPGWLAAVMCLKYLHKSHYPVHYRRISTCKPLAQRAFALARVEPYSIAELRRRKSLAGISKSKIDTTFVELQVVLNIMRPNSPEVKRDTWLPFTEQYHQPEGRA